MTELQVMSIVGIDTGGGTWGISFLDYIGMELAGHAHIQVDNLSAIPVLKAMLGTYYHDQSVIVRRFAGVEEFEEGQSAGTRGKPGKITRQGVFEAVELLQLWGYYVKTRKAAFVKPKITDKVLKEAGILQPPEMRHANDGSRQAMFAAINDAYRPNPLR